LYGVDCGDSNKGRWTKHGVLIKPILGSCNEGDKHNQLKFIGKQVVAVTQFFLRQQKFVYPSLSLQENRYKRQGVPVLPPVTSQHTETKTSKKEYHSSKEIKIYSCNYKSWKGESNRIQELQYLNIALTAVATVHIGKSRE
jgi:hypothetical protein